jgi:hypothetical protein
VQLIRPQQTPLHCSPTFRRVWGLADMVGWGGGAGCCLQGTLFIPFPCPALLWTQPQAVTGHLHWGPMPAASFPTLAVALPAASKEIKLHHNTSLALQSLSALFSSCLRKPDPQPCHPFGRMRHCSFMQQAGSTGQGVGARHCSSWGAPKLPLTSDCYLLFRNNVFAH